MILQSSPPLGRAEFLPGSGNIYPIVGLYYHNGVAKSSQLRTSRLKLVVPYLSGARFVIINPY